MKKKKLKQRIANLESQLGTEKSRAEAWEYISHCFIDGLKKHGVKTQIIFPEPPLVDASQTEDDVARYVPGINTAPPTLLFDFTERDKKEICDIKEKTEEDNETEEIKQCKEFLKRENKCYIYITNFLATPMVYESLGFSCAVDEVPTVEIEYANGEKSEVVITELMKYDTLEKCEKRCEELNENMKGYRESWNKDFWRLKQLEMENGEDD